MSDDAFNLLMQSLGGQMFGQGDNPTGVVAMLVTETLRFRDKLKADTGTVLTVEDTRTALDALEEYLHDRPLPASLTPEQKALAQIWVDRLTMFKS